MYKRQHAGDAAALAAVGRRVARVRRHSAAAGQSAAATPLGRRRRTPRRGGPTRRRGGRRPLPTPRDAPADGGGDGRACRRARAIARRGGESAKAAALGCARVNRVCALCLWVNYPDKRVNRAVVWRERLGESGLCCFPAWFLASLGSVVHTPPSSLSQGPLLAVTRVGRWGRESKNTVTVTLAVTVTVI